MNIHHPALDATAIIPLSLRDAPAFIEAQFPVGRISAEAYKERKANLGQTLTALGSYWKGRKPLLLVRATVLGCLLPATQDPVGDLHVFLLLMGMDDASFARRIRTVKPADIDPDFPRYHELVAPPGSTEGRLRWREGLEPDSRAALVAEWLATLPYDERLSVCFRPEEVGEDVVDSSAWVKVNAHLGTAASSLPELVEQLGIMRYGHRPVVADTFSGGGSIPFEAARLGCNVYASDLNPIACMLTWAAFNVLGASEEARAGIEAAQRRVAEAVDAKISALGVEHDAEGNRAKAYLYCLETTCPKSGWRVPMIPSLVISKTRKAIAKLVPLANEKRYRIDVLTGVSAAEMAAAEQGTVRDGRLVHPMNSDADGVSLAIVRGDHRVGSERRNNLRLWDKKDCSPSLDDVFGERLYAVQWIAKDTIGASRQTTYFAAATADDEAREAKVEATVRENLARWQDRGWVPDMSILPGDKTDEPIRTRGWTHWHHLFTPRQLQLLAYVQEASEDLDPVHRAVMGLIVARCADNSSKLTRWDSGVGQDRIANTFSNQALNTLYNYAGRAFTHLQAHLFPDFASVRMPGIDRFGVKSVRASEAADPADIFITDPPYADAVNYHEITEYFIAWLRKNPAPPFAQWPWDSRREFAIKGTDEKFRSDMVGAYKAMAERMPDNGIQVVMFTHQNAGIWADLASIMWAAGLCVSAAWNIVTETESALKEGNYVQGTILLVLRKRLDGGNVKRMDIEGEIEDAVDHQLAALNDLDEDWTSERLYTDGDLQLAAYAAALRVITGYATIDRKEVGADVYRKLAKGEKTVIRELIEYAASVANNKLVPDGFPPGMWRDLDASSRFYVRMLDMESKGTTKFADYQDFARTFSVSDYADLMDSTKANAASLAGSGVLKGRILGGKGFGSSPLRRVLFATHKTMQKDDPREGLAFLKMELGQDYWLNRAKLVALAKYVSVKTTRTRPIESSAADLLAQRLEVDKV